MSYEDPDKMAVIQAAAKLNAWTQKMFNLLDYKVDGRRDIRLAGTRAHMQPPQTLINARSYFFMLGELTNSTKLKRICRIALERLNKHADLYMRYPLPYEDLADIMTEPTMKQMETQFKMAGKD